MLPHETPPVQIALASRVMINLKSLFLLIAFAVFIIAVPLGLVRFGVDLWKYYYPSGNGSQKAFQDHGGLGMALAGLVICAVFTLLHFHFSRRD